jgi:hypothetical protein
MDADISSASMHTTDLLRLVAKLALVAALSISISARADDADIDVPGPTGRSWVAIDGSYARSSNNTDDSSGFESRSRASSRSTTLYGAYAINEQVDVSLNASRQLYRSTSTYSFGSSQFSDASNSTGVGLRVRAWGTPTSEGFGLVGSVSADHSEGGSTIYSGTLMPQYRFNDSLLTSFTLGLARGSEDWRAQFAQASLVWKAAPDLSIMPAVNWSRWDSSDSYPSQHSLQLDLGASYHLNHNLSVLAWAYVWRTSDVDTGLFRITNSRSRGVSLGLRWAF